jgi:hypothetical protein
MSVKLSALCSGRPVSPRRILVLISVRSWVDPRTIVWLEGVGQLKNPTTSSWTEPATFWVVTKCLNQLLYLVPKTDTQFNETKWLLEIIGVCGQCYELSKQLQGLHIDMALHSETHLEPHEMFLTTNYYFYRTDRFPERKRIPHNHVGLCYMCDTYTWQRRSLFMRDKPILSSEVLRKTYDRRGSVAKQSVS